jgi:hypothetical protein
MTTKISMNIEKLFVKIKIYKIKNVENVYKISWTHEVILVPIFYLITHEESTITFISHHVLWFISITVGAGRHILMYILSSSNFLIHQLSLLNIYNTITFYMKISLLHEHITLYKCSSLYILTVHHSSFKNGLLYVFT